LGASRGRSEWYVHPSIHPLTPFPHIAGFDWASLPAGSTVVDFRSGIESTSMQLAEVFENLKWLIWVLRLGKIGIPDTVVARFGILTTPCCTQTHFQTLRKHPPSRSFGLILRRREDGPGGLCIQGIAQRNGCRWEVCIPQTKYDKKCRLWKQQVRVGKVWESYVQPAVALRSLRRIFYLVYLFLFPRMLLTSTLLKCSEIERFVCAHCALRVGRWAFDVFVKSTIFRSGR